MNNIKILIIPLVVTLASLLVLVVLGANNWLTEQGITALEFCEQSSSGIIKQPINTYSNGAFVLVGLLIAYHAWWNFCPSYYPIMYSCLVILVGFGSAAMHASTTLWGGIADMSAMYLLASFMVSYGLVRLFRLPIVCHLVIYGLIIIISGLMYGVRSWGINCNYLFAGMLVLFFLIELAVYWVRRQSDFRWLWLSVIFIGLAFAIWIPSCTDGTICNPSSWFQGHAVWHLLAAMSSGTLYVYYASRRTTVDF